jgi:hypothetical protein
MTDPISNFWSDFDAIQREVQAAIPVVPLRHDMTHKARVRIAVQSLAFTLMNLEWMGEAAPEEFTKEDVEAIEKGLSKLQLLLPKLRMKHSTVDLCGKFGRAP